MKVSFPLVLFAAIFPSFAQVAVDTTGVQKKAIEMYPSLGEAGSPLNTAFIAAVSELRTAHDPILTRKEWPLLIARREAQKLGLAPGSSPTATPPAEAVPLPTPWRAQSLLSVYTSNELAADATLKGRTIVLCDFISGIGKDLLGNPYLTFVEPNQITGVQCLFSEDKIEELSKLSKGQAVKVTGTVSGKTFNVILRDCSLN